MLVSAFFVFVFLFNPFRVVITNLYFYPALRTGLFTLDPFRITYYSILISLNHYSRYFRILRLSLFSTNLLTSGTLSTYLKIKYGITSNELSALQIFASALLFYYNSIPTGPYNPRHFSKARVVRVLLIISFTESLGLTFSCIVYKNAFTTSMYSFLLS